MIRTTIFLTARQLQLIQLEKEATGLSMAEIVRRAIDEYFEHRLPWPKETLEEGDG